MAIPQSAKLKKEESKKPTPAPFAAAVAAPVESGPIAIKVVECLNDNVAVLRFKMHSTIAMPDGVQFKNEGIVIGIGPGVAAGDGTRCPSQLAIGDVVMFMDRNVITELAMSTPPYKDCNVILISERSLLCKLPPVEFTMWKP